MPDFVPTQMTCPRDMRARLGRLFFHTTRFSGVNELVGRRYSGLGTIFMLHSVVINQARYLFDGNHTSTAFLESFLHWARKKGIEFITLDQALARMESSTTTGRRFAVLTFDDGYADNLSNALPILERYQVPFTVYVTTELVTRQVFFWWRGLQCLFRDNSEVAVEALGRQYSCSSMNAKYAAYREVKQWVARDVTGRAPLLKETFRKYNIPLSDLLDREALSAEQLRTLASHQLVTIGGHTTSHPELAKLTEAEVRREVLENRVFLEGLIDKPVSHFAYPFGGPSACGHREERLVKDLGFKSATTTRRGNIFPEHHERPCALPRAAFNGNKEHLNFMAMQIGGIRRMIDSRMGTPVVTM